VRARAARDRSGRVRPVLVVEDDGETRDALVQAFRAAGYDVLASDEGRKALELAAAVKPCAVVLDLMMEGMSGLEFLERRRAIPPLLKTPVIVITGSTAPVRDASAVVTKPFELSDLLATVRRLVGR
jgi:CheY-like chemotaxis protein